MRSFDLFLKALDEVSDLTIIWCNPCELLGEFERRADVPGIAVEGYKCQ